MLIRSSIAYVRLITISDLIVSLLTLVLHRNTAQPLHYWDLGLKAFRTIMKQHYAVCKANWVCKRLSLDNIQVENLSESSHVDKITPTCSKQSIDQHRMNVKYVLNSGNVDSLNLDTDYE